MLKVGNVIRLFISVVRYLAVQYTYSYLYFHFCLSTKQFFPNILSFFNVSCTNNNLLIQYICEINHFFHVSFQNICVYHVFNLKSSFISRQDIIIKLYGLYPLLPGVYFACLILCRPWRFHPDAIRLIKMPTEIKFFLLCTITFCMTCLS